VSHLLLLRDNGSVELYPTAAAAGEPLWNSDSDDDFKDQVSDEFLTEADVGDILDYLVEQGELTDNEADACIVEEEAQAPGESEPEPIEGELDDESD
jgi:hypothetical protein